MNIGGIQRFSLIDYPGKIAAVLFCQGCAFRCPFCHNPDLVDTKRFSPPLSLEEILLFLQRRTNGLEAVVFSGGEPTLYSSLPFHMKKIKKLGFAIKLDTTGIHPEMIQQLLQESLVDYIAMDIKGPWHRYTEIAGVAFPIEPIQKTISLILSSSIPYEFRSTILPSLHSKEDLLAMGQMVQGARLYVLQNFRNTITLSPALKTAKSFSEQELLSFQKMLSPFVQECHIR